MNQGYIYAVVAFVSMFQLLLALNRSKNTRYKETIDREFCEILVFFSGFCFVDCCWGICFAGFPFVNIALFNIATYAYHTMSALSAFVWFGYMMSYMKIKDKIRKALNIVRLILIVIQIAMIIVNAFNGEGFYVAKDLSYHIGRMRIYMYLAQFLYYVVILCYTSTCAHMKQRNKRNKNAFLFSLVPLMFGIGQLLFYDVSMYSMGFMVSGFIIYAYNVTEMREEYLTQRAENLHTTANIDALTGLLNRRAYETKIASYPKIPVEDDFVYASMDLNGLKLVNDKLGHKAGDELIKGAAKCMKMCLGSYGRIYRTGGDEFVAMIYANEEQLKKIREDFAEITLKWSGNFVKNLSISCGFVAKKEFPNMQIVEMSKIADERMYKEKAAYYATKGIDRHGQQEAHIALCSLYTKILKINLQKNSYQIISLMEEERKQDSDFSDTLSRWLHDAGTSGQVHKGDLEKYLRMTDVNYLKNYFKQGKSSIHIMYRRKFGNMYRKAIMEMIPAGDYTENNQSLFLYVRDIDF